LVNEVSRSFPRDVKILASIGGFYERSGMPAEAETTWTRALVLEPGNKQIMGRLTHLGEVRTGDKTGEKRLH
jgi:hypothetical protein